MRLGRDVSMVVMSLRPFDSMRIALAALLTIAPITAAAAQSESVTVNSMGVVSGSGDGQVLIDPGTGQARVLPPLMQPWQFRQEPVKLHPPRKHAKQTETISPPADTLAVAPEAPKPRKHKAAPEPAPAQTETYAAAPPPKPRKQVAATPAPAAEPAPKPRRMAAAPAPQPAPAQSSGSLSGFADLETITSNTAPKAAPPPAKPAAPPIKTVAALPKPPTPTVETPHPASVQQAAKPAPKTASIEPPKPSKPHVAAGNRRDSIAFAPNASDPSSSAVGSVRNLASTLANQLGDSNTRIQLMAYAGQKGEKTSDTRRLSLKRALVVRQLLIDDGIPAERIDVFALGGVDDDGPLDRVDVMVKG